MVFPTKYKILTNNRFILGDNMLVPIRYEDRIDIMKWRNEQIYHLRQDKLLTENAQNKYFKNTVLQLFEENQPDQLLFSFLENEKCIGYGGLVHINWIDKNAEISFIMNPELEAKYFSTNWINYLKLIEKIAFEELFFHKLYTYAYDLRPQLYPILEHVGFKMEARLIEHCYFNKQYIDVIIHSKLNYNEYS